jgi:hypothetical protein
MEDKFYCVQSALQIRAVLIQEINSATAGRTLELSLKAMRAACRRFVEAAGPNASNFYQQPELLSQHQFGIALGDLRTSIGFYVAAMAGRFGIDVDDDLARILPAADDDPSWIPGFERTGE